MKKRIKRIFAIFAVALLLCGIVPLTASAANDVTTAFTDPAFRAVVQALVGKDAILDTDIAGITMLDVSGDWKIRGDIKSLAGLEHFVNLTILVCSGNQLTQLPALPSGLTILACDFNSLAELPSLPTGLRMLDCFANQLTELPALPSGLISIGCSANELTALPALPTALENLSCLGNRLKALPALPSGLKVLNCAGNQLTALPALPASLISLHCYMNNLTEIDVTGLALEELHCYSNYLPDKSAVIGFVGEWDDGKEYDERKFDFEPQKKPVDKTALNEIIARARAIKKGNYTQYGWDALQRAVAAAQAIADDPETTQEQADSGVVTLENAIDWSRFYVKRVGFSALTIRDMNQTLAIG